MFVFLLISLLAHGYSYFSASFIVPRRLPLLGARRLPLLGARRLPLLGARRLPLLGACRHFEIEVDTGLSDDGRLGEKPRQEISVHDLTEKLNLLLMENTDIRDGIATVSTLHTTTSIIVNEYEEFLASDISSWMLRMIPPSYPYKHNNILHRPSGAAEYQRCIENGFDVDDPVELKVRQTRNAPIQVSHHRTDTLSSHFAFLFFVFAAVARTGTDQCTFSYCQHLEWWTKEHSSERWQTTSW